MYKILCVIIVRDNINRLSRVKIEDHSSDETDYDIPTQKIGFNKEIHPLSLMVSGDLTIII